MELEHRPGYGNGKKKVRTYKQIIALALKKRE